MIASPFSRACTLLLASFLSFIPPLSAQDAPGSSIRYYVSNDLGMAFEQIGWYRREEFPYILVVKEEADWETRTLLHQGEELRRWEIGPSEERIYHRTVIEERRRYDERGRVVEEQLYQDGEPGRRTVYHYNREVLDRAETFGPAGELLFRDLYRLAPDGQLRRVNREQVDNRSDQQLALSGGGGDLSEERYGNSRERRINRYDPMGRLVEREYWHDGELAERERFQYRGESELLSGSQLEEPPLQRATQRSYDEEGRIIHSVVEQREEVIEQTFHVRDERGRIVETSMRGLRGIENWLFAYGPEDDLVREEYRLRGSLERITLYFYEGEEPSRLEELYRGGKIFMRIYYEGEQKVKEEFLRNGEVVRARELE